MHGEKPINFIITPDNKNDFSFHIQTNRYSAARDCQQFHGFENEIN